jgi:outer membrane receptor protein involved in Fe transport
VTYTHGKIATDEITPENVGRRINPRFTYQLTPTYTTEKLIASMNIIGTSRVPIAKTFAPEYTQVNVSASYALTKGLWLSLHGNNIFNAIGVTEIPSGSVSANGLNTARSINGRTLLVSLKYSFE